MTKASEQFLYKRFACDAEQLLIHLYHIKSNKIIHKVPIKNQSQEDYFYGSDLVFEEYLGNTESSAASIIEEMISNEWVPQFQGPNFASYFISSCYMNGVRKPA